MIRKLFLLIVLHLIPLCVLAQGNPLVHIPITELLQYQVQKGKHNAMPYSFSKYGLRQIRTELVVNTGDSRQLWGWHVTPNTDFDQSRQPLYRIFSKVDNSSIAVIDDKAGTLQIIFWDKAYYLYFAKDLRSHSFYLHPKKPSQNILRFLRKDCSVGVDVTVWVDMYVVSFFYI